jgi:2-keto-3-deoxy-L-rhamnonate aldolase RhmA
VRENPVKRRLADGEIVLGTMVAEMLTPALFRIAAAAEAEFLLLDREHGAWSLETVRSAIGSGLATNVVPIVRVPDAQYHLVAQTLDAGAMGVMIPACDDEAEARSVVAWAKYPPLGRRGVGIQRYELEPDGVAATLAKANSEQMIIVQIETRAGLDSVERIAAVEGVDVLWVGHFDLTTSLGMPGEFHGSEFEAALDRILAACEAAGKAAGIMVTSVYDGRRFI